MVASDDQEGRSTRRIRPYLSANLANGAFRLVLVLDEAPRELVRLVGYVERVGENLVLI